jgi:hypothetical protein
MSRLVSFLFWNIGKRPLQEQVARLVAEHGVDVLMLAECEIPPTALIAEINRHGEPFCFPFSAASKVQVFTRFAESALTPVYDDPALRLTIRQLIVEERTDLLLAVVHFHSRLNWTEEDQLIEVSNLARDIVERENERGHRRTVLVGDFNMNPFDKGVVAANGLHAVMTRDIARRGEREVAARRYPFFYNPMWGCFGDRTVGPPGSHYFVGKHVSYFWHIYDQVMLRPALMDSLREIKILEGEGHTSLLSSQGHPNSAVGSDHLPILFRLEL